MLHAAVTVVWACKMPQLSREARLAAAGQPVEAMILADAPWPQLHQQQQLNGMPALQPVTHAPMLNLPAHRPRPEAMPAQDRRAHLIQVRSWKSPEQAMRLELQLPLRDGSKIEQTPCLA